MQILQGTLTHAHNLRHFSLATSGHGNHVYFAPNVVLRTLMAGQDLQPVHVAELPPRFPAQAMTVCMRSLYSGYPGGNNNEAIATARRFGFDVFTDRSFFSAQSR